MEVLRRLGESVGAVGLAGGQVMDLQCEGKDGVTLQELQWIHAHKTAALLKVCEGQGRVCMCMWGGGLIRSVLLRAAPCCGK